MCKVTALPSVLSLQPHFLSLWGGKDHSPCPGEVTVAFCSQHETVRYSQKQFSLVTNAVSAWGAYAMNRKQVLEAVVCASKEPTSLDRRSRFLGHPEMS